MKSGFFYIFPCSEPKSYSSIIISSELTQIIEDIYDQNWS